MNNEQGLATEIKDPLETFSAFERSSIQAFWTGLIGQKPNGLSTHSVQDVHFACMKFPTGRFNLETMAADELMLSNGSEAIVKVVEGRFGPNCLYLESRSLGALKALLWKHRIPGR